MKWLGAIILVVSTTCIGLYFSNRYEKRPKYIRQLESALQLLEAEITYSQTPLHLAFQTISRQLPHPISHFFQSLSEAMVKQEIDFIVIWNEKTEELRRTTSLKKNEIEVLKQFGNSLGQHDFIHQQKQIRLALTHLERELEEARDESYKYSNLARSLGVLTGIFIVLLLL